MTFASSTDWAFSSTGIFLFFLVFFSGSLTDSSSTGAVSSTSTSSTSIAGFCDFNFLKFPPIVVFRRFPLTGSPLSTGASSTALFRRFPLTGSPLSTVASSTGRCRRRRFAFLAGAAPSTGASSSVRASSAGAASSIDASSTGAASSIGASSTASASSIGASSTASASSIGASSTASAAAKSSKSKSATNSSDVSIVSGRPQCSPSSVSETSSTVSVT